MAEMLDNTLDPQNTTEAYQATQYFLRRRLPPSLYYKFRTFSRQYPLLFLPFARWRWERWRKRYCPETSGPEPAAPQPLMPDSEIVIEGFPRTANTFTHIAFKIAQPRPVKIAHHTHAAAQVIAGARKGLPTIVLIRAPEEAVISYLIGEFDREITMRQVLHDYIAFYKPILPYQDRFVLAPFEEITQDYGQIIRRVNEKFGANFAEFEHTPENVQQCFAMIDEGYMQSFGTLKETVVSRPSESRKSQQAALKDEFYSEPLKSLRTQACSIYETLMNQAKPTVQ
ncbi:MAG: hypothetical protein MUF72_20820 [Elainella sp. Prado103]|jgi:hypothetical protein|nr:hypothetical protein [Elainella sp. Prado103]